MKHPISDVSRRTVSRTIAGAALAGLAGCLGGSGATQLGSQDQFSSVGVDGTKLVVELVEGAEVEQINLIRPNGELFGQRTVAAGAEQVSFELRTTYTPGEYRIIGLKNDESLTEITTEIRPEIQIHDVGLFRNHPDKAWDEAYGSSPTNTKKNGEAFVTVQNSGTGPGTAVELRFSGDVPNPIENPRGNGMNKTDSVVIQAGETVDLFSDSFPFGSEIGGMGCTVQGNSGQFTVELETQTTDQPVTKTFDVEYSGSEEVYDCEITIGEV